VPCTIDHGGTINRTFGFRSKISSSDQLFVSYGDRFVYQLYKTNPATTAVGDWKVIRYAAHPGSAAADPAVKLYKAISDAAKPEQTKYFVIVAGVREDAPVEVSAPA
jgi:hypothetical protein